VSWNEAANDAANGAAMTSTANGDKTDMAMEEDPLLSSAWLHNKRQQLQQRRSGHGHCAAVSGLVWYTWQRTSTSTIRA